VVIGRPPSGGGAFQKQAAKIDARLTLYSRYRNEKNLLHAENDYNGFDILRWNLAVITAPGGARHAQRPFMNKRDSLITVDFFAQFLLLVVPSLWWAPSTVKIVQTRHNMLTYSHVD
jgi:hypothetical protein